MTPACFSTISGLQRHSTQLNSMLRFDAKHLAHSKAQSLICRQRTHTPKLQPINEQRSVRAFATTSDMRLPKLMQRSHTDYPLEKISSHHSLDYLSIESWPGGQSPEPAISVRYDHQVGKQLIDDIDDSIQWLVNESLTQPAEQKQIDDVQTKVIDMLDFYAGHYWLPLTFERLTPHDWQTLAETAKHDMAAAHYLSLTFVQLAYCANSSEDTRLQHALARIRAAGLAIDPICCDQTTVEYVCRTQSPAAAASMRDSLQENRLAYITPSPINAPMSMSCPETFKPRSPVLGYLMRHDRHKSGQKNFWMLGLAGTQSATLSSNIQASIKAILINDKHWGYSEYYSKVIKPSLLQLLDAIKDCEGDITLPDTIHIAGHSMGGALAQFAALDFPPTSNDKVADHKKNAHTPDLVIHLNNSTRAGNHGLRRQLNNKGVQCVSSSHRQDIVATVPPDFLGFSEPNANPYPNSLLETAHKLKLLGKNWREGFVTHRLAVFLLLYTPEILRPIFLEKALHMPAGNNYETLGYTVTGVGRSEG